MFVKAIKCLKDGGLDLKDLSCKYRKRKNIHQCIGRLVVLENTIDGMALTPQYFKEVGVNYKTVFLLCYFYLNLLRCKVRQMCNEFGLLIHLDGARIVNAVAALKCDVKEFMKCVDSACISLSKVEIILKLCCYLSCIKSILFA